MKNSHDSNTRSIVLIGTSDFAIPIFQAIQDDKRFTIAALITQPDKETGRKKMLTPPPVKEWASSYPIRVFQPETLKDAYIKNELMTIAPDIMLVVAYGKMIPQELIELPHYKTVNVHPSLLPHHRGPSPLQYAILKGDTKTGVSIMLIDDQMDHGPILNQIEYPLNGTETYQELSDTLSRISANIIADVLYDYCENNIVPAEQMHDDATYTKLITTNDGLLFFEKPAIELERRVRALNPEPGTYCMINGQRVKIRIVRLIDGEGEPGTFFVHEGSLAVYCGTDALLLEEVQPAGKQWMTGETFVHGHGLPT